MRDFGSLSLRDYASIIRRRLWYLIFTPILIGAGTFVYVQRMPSIYKSVTTITVPPRVVPEDYIPSLDRLTSNELIAFVSEQIQARTFAERIVRDLHLAGPEPGALDAATNSVRANISMSTLSSTLFTLGFAATDPAIAHSVTKRMSELVLEFNTRKERVQVADRFIGEEGRRAQEALDRADGKLSEFRNRYFGNLSTEASPYTLALLKAQLESNERSLDSAMNSRKEFNLRLNEQKMLTVVGQLPAVEPTTIAARSDHDVSPPVSPLEEKVARKKEEYAAAIKKYTPNYPGIRALAQEMRDLEAQLSESRANPATKATTNSPTAPAPNAAPAITSVLPADTSSAFFEVEGQIELEKINKNISKLEQEHKELLNKISVLEYQLNPPPALAKELAALTDDYNKAKLDAGSLDAKKRELEMTARVDANDRNELFKILDPANLPKSPAGPNRPLYRMAGLLAGILLGFGAVFAREFLDPTLFTEEDVVSELGLPVLACIPKTSPPKDTRTDKSTRSPKKTLGLVTAELTESKIARSFDFHSIDASVRAVLTDQVSMAGEQFRLLRTTLSSLQKQRSLRTLLVTSAVPNEGKTYLASCLAGTMALEPGKKALLIDADLRTGRAGSVFGAGRDSIGLVDMIRGTAVLEQCVIKCAEMNLYCLPTGQLDGKPADLLSSPEFERHLRHAEDLFDWVIIDSPPAMALADAKIIASLCDATLLTVSCAKTPKSLVKEAIQRVGRERIAGTVLNRVHRIRGSSYYNYYAQIASPKSNQIVPLKK
jgi:capsular exopolysaccharide synthesis family protein